MVLEHSHDFYLIYQTFTTLILLPHELFVEGLDGVLVLSGLP